MAAAAAESPQNRPDTRLPYFNLGINSGARRSSGRGNGRVQPVTLGSGELLDARRRRFEAEVLQHLDAALRFARWLCRAPGDAEDIVQDAVLRAYRAFDSLRGSDAKSWLLTIVRNCHSTALAQQLRRAHVPLPDEEDAPEHQTMIATIDDPERAAMRLDAARTLQRHLSALADEHREVLVLREFEELDYREIAAVIDVPIGTVMSRLARARAALKARLLKDGWEGESRAVR